MAYYNLTQTGAEVQVILDRVAAGYIYMGTADLTTTPDTTNPNVCYLLKAVGTYTNFGNIQHSSGIGIALWNGTAWSYQNVPSSAVVATDATPTEKSTNPVQSGGVYDILYGEQPHEYAYGNLVYAIIASNGSVNASSPRCGYYIPLLGGESIYIKANSTSQAYYCCVKSIVTTSGQTADLATGWSGMLTTTKGGSVTFTAPEDARYLYIGHIVTSDASAIKDPAELVINDWDVINQEYIGEEPSSGLVARVEALEGFHGLLKLSVAEHNEGMYHYGEQPYGISQADWDTGVAAWKSLLTKTDSDFLACMEHKQILNADETGVANVNSYDELYKQFYPYRVDADTLGSTTFQIALYSKYPIKSYEKINLTSTGRYFNKFIVDVESVEICIVVQKGYAGTPGSEGATSRVAEFTELVSLVANNPIVIIPIDTNSQYTEDFDVFRNNGYQLGNFGYWGEKKTCGISETYPQGHYAFDNIIVKGMDINSFDVCDEHATSDHFPTMSKLTKYFE